MKRRTLKMETVKLVVLDEADEMLDMGFREDIEIILKKIPDDRQTILFRMIRIEKCFARSSRHTCCFCLANGRNPSFASFLPAG